MHLLHLFHIDPLHFDSFNGFLNYVIHFENIFNYWIPQYINFTKLALFSQQNWDMQSKYYSVIYISLQQSLQASNWIIYIVKNCKHLRQLCCFNITSGCVSAALVKEGVQPLQFCLEGQYEWFRLRHMAYDSSIHWRRVIPQVDIPPGQSPYLHSDIYAMFQISKSALEVFQCLIKHPQGWKDTLSVREYVKWSAYLGYLNSSQCQEMVFHILVTYAFVTL